MREDTEDRRGVVIPVTINGIEGTVEFGDFGPAAHGRWASHTGYRSMAGAYHGVEPHEYISEALAGEIAQQLYDQQAPLAFIVWEEHKEHGWHWVEKFNGRLEIKIPKWAEPEIIEILEAHGMNQSGKGDVVNHRWSCLEADMPVEKLKEKLAPLLQPGTRLADQKELARELMEGIQNELF